MWIKICGIRDVQTALDVAACGVQAIGLNFYEQSPRAVAPDVAAEIVARLPAGVEPVGLFVNHSPSQIREIAGRCGLRTLQLHGDEPPDVLAELSDYNIARAFRVGDEGLSFVGQYLERCRQLRALPWACLVDARVAGQYGGTGQTAPWDLLKREYNTRDWPPLILAGGLRPENVGAAISRVTPWGVDVAGGVEASQGCKDISRVRDFVSAARHSGGREDGG